MSQIYNYPPTQDDINRITNMFKQVRDLARELDLGEMDYSLADLFRMQAIIDASLASESEYIRRCLGIAFGCVFIQNHDGYHWWMFADEDGTEVCIRFLDTELILFPEPYINNKLAAGERLDLFLLYQDTSEQMLACEADLD